MPLWRKSGLLVSPIMKVLENSSINPVCGTASIKPVTKSIFFPTKNKLFEKCVESAK